MSLAVINTNTNTSKNYSATMDPTTNTNQSAIDTHRRQIIKRKVLAIGKLSRSYAVLKEHPELVKQLKTLSANGKLPFGTLANGEQGIREAIIATASSTAAAVNCSKLKEVKDLCHVAVATASSPNNYKLASRGEGHV